MRRGEADIQRYVYESAGITTAAERARQIDDLIRYRQTDQPDANPFGRGFFVPSGCFFQPAGVTSIASGDTGARYLGTAPDDLRLVTLAVNVVTAGSTITWSEFAIATALDATLGTGPDLTLAGFTSVNSVVNSTGRKVIEVAVDIAAGAHCYALWGSQAGTPFQLRASYGDDTNAGFVSFATARPSTMTDPTSFTISLIDARAAFMAVQW
jgi:hypothetical protein